MKQTKKDYNERKLFVLNLADSNSEGITPTDLRYEQDLNYALSKQLLYHYRKQGLLSHRKRGIYRITRKGRDRLAYLKARQDIIEATGIDITLNHHRAPPISSYEIMNRFEQATGRPFPLGFRL